MALIMTTEKHEETRREKALKYLLQNPSAFTFDAAFHLIQGTQGKKEVFFQVTDNLITPTAYLVNVEEEQGGKRFKLTTSFSGFVGHNGVLPRYFTAELSKENNGNSYALNDLLNLLTQRPLQQFAFSGIKYQPYLQLTEAVSAKKSIGSVLFTKALLALSGQDPTLSSFKKIDETRIYFAGLFSSYPHSAEKLRNFLEAWLESRVTIKQFQGKWRDLPLCQQTKFPFKNHSGQYHQLGKGAVLGKRYWDIHGSILIVVGPLNFRKFSALLPPSKILQELRELIQLYLGKSIDFRLQLVLNKREVPPIKLGRTRLGLNSWLPSKGERSIDPDDLILS